MNSEFIYKIYIPKNGYIEEEQIIASITGVDDGFREPEYQEIKKHMCLGDAVYAIQVGYILVYPNRNRKGCIPLQFNYSYDCNELFIYFMDRIDKYWADAISKTKELGIESLV